MLNVEFIASEFLGPYSKDSSYSGNDLSFENKKCESAWALWTSECAIFGSVEDMEEHSEIDILCKC